MSRYFVSEPHKTPKTINSNWTAIERKRRVSNSELTSNRAAIARIAATARTAIYIDKHGNMKQIRRYMRKDEN